MLTTLQVQHCGPFVSYQDSGRSGYMRFGIPHSGPMDRQSFTIAKAALNNLGGDTHIEISLGGLTLKCLEGGVTTALVGGAFDVAINNHKVDCWSVFNLGPQDTLQIRPGKSGSWCYLGFLGEVKAASWLGSQSNHLNSGLCGQTLTSGSTIEIENSLTNSSLQGPLPNLKPEKGNKLRAVLGPQDRYFATETVELLRSSKYTVSHSYDRMGMRLDGEKIQCAQTMVMPSEGLARGSVQIAGDGTPTILLADHQTTGGYPKIATLVTSDQDKATQLRSGDDLGFEWVSVEDASQIYHADHTRLQDYCSSLQSTRGTLEERLRRSNLVSGMYAD
ncbi:MAG: biotin-dependent carboxylase-like uncharacterized protein [Parasphingorhabdus sp.]